METHVTVRDNEARSGIPRAIPDAALRTSNGGAKNPSVKPESPSLVAGARSSGARLSQCRRAMRRAVDADVGFAVGGAGGIEGVLSTLGTGFERTSLILILAANGDSVDIAA